MPLVYRRLVTRRRRLARDPALRQRLLELLDAGLAHLKGQTNSTSASGCFSAHPFRPAALQVYSFSMGTSK